MEFTSDYKGRADKISDLFSNTFSDSEGAEEGKLIGTLAGEMIATTPDEDLHVFLSSDNGELTGCIMFTRLTYPQDDRSVFILAPVAVKTNHQRRGVGQELIRYGLNYLGDQQVDVAVTYGDPNYYARIGFVPISEEVAQAPLKLQFPEGWQAQSLNGHPLEPLKGPSFCVEALNRPEYW